MIADAIQKQAYEASASGNLTKVDRSHSLDIQRWEHWQRLTFVSYPLLTCYQGVVLTRTRVRNLNQYIH